MKSLPLIWVTFSLMLALTLPACEGPTGPEGAQGEKGEQGPPGVVGITSETFSISNVPLDGSPPSFRITMPAITTEVMEEGVVMAYVSGNGQRWTALPVTLLVQGVIINFGFAIEYGTFVGFIRVSEGTIGNTFSLFDQLRVVVIPPGASKKGVDVNNYEEVAQAYGLSE